MSTVQRHWNKVYTEKGPSRLSWFEATPERSLAMIDAAGLPKGAAIIDAGGGASRLAAELLERGYRDLTVADISESALEHSRRALGDASGSVTWVVTDLRDADLGRQFDLWHDRAVLHFMVEIDDRDRYLATVRRSLRPGGQLIIAGFGPDGPTRCSGLPVRRHGAEELGAALGDDFTLVESEIVDHETPSGSDQQFLYARFERNVETADQLLDEARSDLDRVTPP